MTRPSALLPLICLLLVAGALASRTGHAEEPPTAEALTDEQRIRRADRLDQRAERLLAEGQVEEAMKGLQEALRYREQTAGGKGLVLADALMLWSRRLWDAGHSARARPLAERALRLYEGEWGPGDPRLGVRLVNLAMLLQAEGDLVGAHASLQRALALLEQANGPDHEDVARVLAKVASLHAARGQGAEALEAIDRALRIAQVGAEEDALLAEVLVVRGEVLHALGRPAEARGMFERGLRIEEARGGPGSSAAVKVRGNLGIVLIELGEYGVAESTLRRSLEDAERVRGPGHPTLAGILGPLARACELQGRYDEALALVERSLRILEAVHGPEHPALCDTLNGLGALRKSLGMYEEAQAALDRGLALAERTYGESHGKVANLLLNLSGVHAERGRFAEARAALARAIAIDRKVLGPDHPSTALALGNQAHLLLREGRHEEALAAAQQSLQIRERALGGDHPDVALALALLADVHWQQGMRPLARPLVERALRIQEAAHGPEHPYLAQNLNRAATILLDQDEPALAQPLAERAVAILKRTLGPDHASVVRALTVVAQALRDQGRLEEALAVLADAQAILDRSPDATREDAADLLDAMALVLGQQGRRREARDVIEKAVPLLVEALGAAHPRVADLAVGLGVEHRFLGDLGAALREFERAAAIYSRTLGPEHADTTNALWHIANVRRDRGDLPGAEEMLARVIRSTERATARRLPRLAARDRLDLLPGLRALLRDWLRIQGERGKPGYREVLRLKGLIGRVEAGERLVARRWSSDLEEKRATVAAAERRLARLAGEVPRARDAEARGRWQEQYAAAAREVDELGRALEEDVAPLREALRRIDVEVEDVQWRLPEGAVLVDLLRVEDRYLAFVVPRSGDVRRVPLGDAAGMEAAVRRFLRPLYPSRADGEPDEPGPDLAEGLVGPLAEALAGAERLYLCPDGALATVPLTLLPWPGSPLVSCVATAADLIPPEAPGAPGSGALLLGSVAYGPGHRFALLPSTGEEVAEIAARIGKGAVVLEGEEASEANVRRDCPGRRILHLATHGFIRSDLARALAGAPRRGPDADPAWMLRRSGGYDPMVLPGLALAGANSGAGGGADDGILTGLEVLQLDLDGAELVVLSACSTAGGTPVAGEGMLGLVRAFQVAGARNVVASLWPVDDRATRLLMGRFYELLLRETAPLTPAEALQEASRSLREWTHGSGARPYDAPRYWAAFVCYERR